MSRSHLAVTALALFVSLASAARGQTWAIRIGDSTDGWVFSAALLPSGNVAVLHRDGVTRITELTPDGVAIASRTVSQRASALTVTDAGEVALAGSTSILFAARNVLSSPASSGSLAWADQHAEAPGRVVESEYVDVITAQNGDLIWTGWKASDDSDRQLVVERTTAQGQRLWSLVRGDSSAFFSGSSVVELSSGDILVAGTSQFGRPFIQVISADGSPQSAAQYQEAGVLASPPHVTATDDGGAALLSGAPSGTRVKKLGPTGSVLWDRSYPGVDGMDVAVDVAGKPGGGCIVLGVSTLFGAEAVRLLHLTALGDIERETVFHTGMAMEPFRLTRTPGGDLLISGRVRLQAGGWQGMLIRLDESAALAGCEGVEVFSAVSSNSTAEVVPNGPMDGIFLLTGAGASTAQTTLPAVTHFCPTAPIGSIYCSPAALNSTGTFAQITARGSVDVGDNWLSLSTISLPPNSSGYHLASQGTGVSSPALAQGDLCLNGAPIARFSASPFFSGAQGTASRAIDLTSIPGQGAVLVGQTWNFQAWYRDANPIVTSNFTDAVSVSF